MGGRLGAGPIPDKDDAVVFHSNWEAHVMANTLACGALGGWSIDSSRYARECLQDYAGLSYYEKWLAALADLLVARDLVSVEEYTTAKPDPAPLHDKALQADAVWDMMHKVVPYTRDAGATRQFKVGDAVRTASTNPNTRHKNGHTRLPAYAMGKVGRIILTHGNHVLPDSNAHRDGEAPEPLYAVEFTAKALWGDEVEDGDCIVLDLWQSYLEAV